MLGGPPTVRDTILDSITEGVFTIDNEWRITSFNRAAEKITRIKRDAAIGQRCCDVFHASICESGCAMRRTFETQRSHERKHIYIVDSSGRRIPLSITTSLLRDSESRIIGGVETFRDLSAEEELRRELHQQVSYHEMISKNPRMQGIFATLPTIAKSDSTALIEGESGTGKELVARAIHELSHRRQKPLIILNCGALPDPLLESELFGYQSGAFTDARRDKPGRVGLAEGGTLFLDEIVEFSPALQVKLLRFLQERTYEPLGATKSFSANVRVIAAHNRNLEQLVHEGRFREDLYYRINVLRISLPPLRERREDIPLLIDHFLTHFSGLQDKTITGFSPEALSRLLSYDYPGNVRELQNIIEHAVVLCNSPEITLRDLPSGPVQDTQLPSGLASLRSMERSQIIQLLNKHHGNRTRAAAELGMHPTTLWRRMKRLQINY